MIYVLCIMLYILMIMGVSFISRKKAMNLDGFLLGGRAIPPWMSAFSYGTAYFSAVLFIGYAGRIGWNFGLGALWIVLGNTFIGSYLAWRVLGKKTREMTQRLNASTMPEFLAARYNSKGIKMITTVVIFVFLIPYAASVYKGLGFLFQQVFDMDINIILFLMMALTAFYLFVGGFMAASLADFIQGLIMIVGVIILLFYVSTYHNVNGIVNGISNLGRIDTKLTKMIHKDTVLPLFSLVVLTSFGSWGLPQMVHKFYTIKDEKSIKTAKWVSTGFALLMTFGAYFTGALSRVVLNNQQPASIDEVMPLVMDTVLPVFASAIILVLVLSASMSTLASIVLAASSTIAVDLVKGGLKPNIDQKQILWLLRILCVVFVFLSYFIAIGDSPVLNLASLSWGAVSGCLFAPYLLGLYSKKVTKAGVYASFITAGGITLYGVLRYGMESPLIPTVSAFSIILPIISMYFVSLLTTEYKKEHIDKVFTQKAVGAE
ncbi:sodium/proline symporter [Natranaerovirga pectinivora]|uniref:Sodium/proline symporter n=1 Tax=Natranaerovirga pectinivora TaxID=682400 RepID=A0A4R3MNJ6_9FIRM|nr:sodium:solute symporter [Natranaerovirga pectinivora]TCT16827.1 sodium/proline symporter [Natranaerovirga pectinivora]